MSKTSNRLLVSLIPFVLFWALRGTNWRRLHPLPTALDEQVRTRLLSADRVDVEIQIVKFPGGGGVSESVTRLPPAATRSVVSCINVTQEQPNDWSTVCVPIVYLNFYAKGKARGSLCCSYSPAGCNYFLDAPSHPMIRRGLHPTSVLRLRELISHYPEITRGLVEAGAKRQYLDPRAFTNNVQ